MKSAKVTFYAQVSEELNGSLKWDDRERSAFVLCHSVQHEGQVKLMPYEVIAPEESDYRSRSAGHYELRKSFTNRAVNRAIETQSDIIQAHVHPPGYPARFSPVDKVDEPSFMKHVAEKVDGIYHASLVFSHDFSSMDGWIFDRELGLTIPLEKIVIVGPSGMDVMIPTGNMADLGPIPDTLSRNAAAFGEDAVRKLGHLDFAVFGASGLSGHIIEMLARSRVKSIMICDPDIIDASNRNRIPGVLSKHEGLPKVDYFSAIVRAIDEGIEVAAYQMSLYEEEVQSAAAMADVAFGGLDGAARHSVNRLACANLLPYFDLGASITLSEGKTSFMGGQIYSVLPGGPACLCCSGAFDNLLDEYLSPEDRAREVRQGYVQGDPSGTTNPLVMDLDMVIAGLGYTQMTKYVFGLGEEIPFKVYYDALAAKATPASCFPVGCLTCQPKGYLGQGDKVQPLVPATGETPAVLDAIVNNR